MRILFRMIFYITYISLLSYGINYEYSKKIEFKKDGIYTKAKIVKFTIREDDEGDISYYPILEFRDTLENLIEFESNVSDAEYIVGDSVGIVYLKNSPEKAMVNSFSSFYNGIIVWGIFLLMGVLFLVIDLYKSISEWRK